MLATGGFQEIPSSARRSFTPNARHIPLRSNPYSTGDGLTLARAAGAGFEPVDAGFYGHLMPAGLRLGETDDLVGLTLYYSEHALLLNLDGQRFVDETVGDHLTTLALLEQPEARASSSPTLVCRRSGFSALMSRECGRRTASTWPTAGGPAARSP